MASIKLKVWLMLSLLLVATFCSGAPVEQTVIEGTKPENKEHLTAVDDDVQTVLLGSLLKPATAEQHAVDAKEVNEFGPEERKPTATIKINNFDFDAVVPDHAEPDHDVISSNPSATLVRLQKLSGGDGLFGSNHGLYSKWMRRVLLDRLRRSNSLGLHRIRSVDDILTNVERMSVLIQKLLAADDMDFKYDDDENIDMDNIPIEENLVLIEAVLSSNADDDNRPLYKNVKDQAAFKALTKKMGDLYTATRAERGFAVSLVAAAHNAAESRAAVAAHVGATADAAGPQVLKVGPHAAEPVHESAGPLAAEPVHESAGPLAAEPVHESAGPLAAEPAVHESAGPLAPEPAVHESAGPLAPEPAVHQSDENQAAEPLQAAQESDELHQAPQAVHGSGEPQVVNIIAETTVDHDVAAEPNVVQDAAAAAPPLDSEPSKPHQVPGAVIEPKDESDAVEPKAIYDIAEPQEPNVIHDAAVEPKAIHDIAEPQEPNVIDDAAVVVEVKAVPLMQEVTAEKDHFVPFVPLESEELHTM